MTDLRMLPSTKADAAALYVHSIEEIVDRLAALQRQESAGYLPVDYLEGTPIERGLRRRHRQFRSEMCGWCHQLVDVTNLSRMAVSRSMNYLDRFMAASHPRARRALVDRREYQLAAMTCLYLSIKVHEPLALDAGLLAEMSDGCYSASEIVEMERCVLRALEWRTSPPTSQEVVCLVLGLLSPEAYGYDIDVLGGLLDVAKFQCEAASADYGLSMCKPSVVALASVLNGLDGLGEHQLSSGGQYAFLTRVCGAMSSANMSQVGFVQDRLRLLMCRGNNETATSKEERPNGRRGSRNVGGGNDGADGGEDWFSSFEDIKCSSPVSVQCWVADEDV